MPKRIIVFFDAEHSRYFQIFNNCLLDGVTITNVYGIGDVEGLAGDCPVLSLKDLNDSVETDGVIILSSQNANIRKLVGLLLKNIGSEQIFEFMQVPEVFQMKVRCYFWNRKLIVNFQGLQHPILWGHLLTIRIYRFMMN